MKDICSTLMFNILKNYMNFIMIYHFHLKEWKLKKSKNFVTNLHDQAEYVIHIRNSKQALNHGYQPYIDMNTKLRQKAKNNVKKDFFKQMNNAVFGKVWGNIEMLNL